MNDPTFLLLANSFVLGLRHGLDWDHIAAIFDIVGTSNGQGLLKFSRNSLTASFCYAFGHGLIVILLGIAAVSFSSTLPQWIDPIMGRAVGFTLLILGLAVLYRACRQLAGGYHEGGYVSRGQIIVSALGTLNNWGKKFWKGQTTTQIDATGNSYTSKTAFAVGAVHGIGAETGSQILLLTAVASANQTLGLAMLFIFVLGLLTCNMFVALAGNAGFGSVIQKKADKAFTFSLGLLTAIFSIVIGVLFIFGMDDHLPDLQKLLLR